MRMKNIHLGTLILLLAYTQSGFSQNNIPDGYGQGLNFIGEDSSFTVKIQMRIQSQYYGNLLLTDEVSNTDAEISNPDSKYSDKILVRRVRLKLDGFVVSSKVQYKLEYDLVSNAVKDAVIIWNFAGNFSLLAGQYKLPGNRERVISSQKLQFVNRSLLNSEYTLGRDKGIQIRNHFNFGKILFRAMSSVSIGEGANYTALNPNSGYAWTQRVEFLPMGKFNGKGDYFGGDLKREDTLKLAIGATYDYNDNALKEQGQRGVELSQMRDIQTVFIDFMLKYKGLSIMGELTDRSTTQSAIILDSTGSVLETYRTGQGFNIQLGYLLKSNWEFATRYTQITPQEITGNPSVTVYTFGVSKYVVGHTLKLQSNVSYLQTEDADDQVEFRVQFEIGF